MRKRVANIVRRGRNKAEHSAGPRDAVIPLVEELTPWLDPWDVARRLAHLSHLLFLDSADTHPSLGRYSFVTADPFVWLCVRRGRMAEDESIDRHVDPFGILSERLKQWQIETVPGLPP